MHGNQMKNLAIEQKKNNFIPTKAGSYKNYFYFPPHLTVNDKNNKKIPWVYI